MRNVDLTSLAGIAVFSTSQAVADGISNRTLHTLTARRRLTRLHHGWYTAVGIEDDEHRHRLSALAAVQLMDGRCVASHHSALVLHGLPVHQVDLRQVFLERSDGSHGRRRPGVVVRAGRSRRTKAAMEGWAKPIPTVSVADACVQSGALHGPMTGLVAADAALRRELCSIEELHAAAERAKGHAGIGGIRAMLRRADGRHETPGETVTAGVLRGTGMAFEPQVEIRTRAGTYFVDFLSEKLRLIVEFDGFEKYANVEDLVAEKIREDALRAKGYRIVRVIWRELFEEGAVAAKIRDVLA
ncbi:DUF559 domain-containing protein [Janibacter sp. YIM B02568]|uniref:DUF559 domain-containing protein n=1 Tax=Janibacter endophyticus TaxID=2806261 RepID=UPI001951FBC9|nr:DUF559 domain-containing protein [Janibacter endophyticus]MBM6546980.1 DUF559 domain-containing protein [Janibacter endophyticus]